MTVRKVAGNILDAIGDTPMVRINRITRGVIDAHGAREDRDVQSRQLDQGPDGGADDRGRRARRPAQAGRHDHRGHVRQHRHGPRHRRGRQGLQVHLHDDRQAVEGEDRRAQGVRRRGHRLPDQRRSRGSALVLLGVVAARARGAELVEGQPVRQPVEHAPRTTSRPAPEIWEQTDGRITHLVVGVGTGGTISGVGRYLKERNPKIKVWGIDTYGSVFKKYKETGVFDKNEIYPVHHRGHRRGLPAEERRLRRHRSLREGHRQGRRGDDAAHRARGGHLRRQLRRVGDGRPAAAARTTSRRTT